MADGNASKRVFLRKVLYRIDFQFITEQKQEDIYSYIAEKYGDYFSDRGCEQGNAVDIEINTNSPEIPKFNSRPQSVYYLTQPKNDTEDGRTIKIGKTFVFLDVDLGIESEYLPYYTWFAEIINFLNEMKLFKPTRIGLRKFNTFFILDKDINRMNEIFALPFFESVNESSFALDHFNNVQVYNGTEYSMNFSRGFSTGLLNNVSIKNEVAHQITFDFDLFSDKPEVLVDFCKDAKHGLECMNNIIYRFFGKIISENICEKINSGDLLSDYGVIPF